MAPNENGWKEPSDSREPTTLRRDAQILRMKTNMKARSNFGIWKEFSEESKWLKNKLKLYRDDLRGLRRELERARAQSMPGLEGKQRARPSLLHFGITENGPSHWTLLGCKNSEEERRAVGPFIKTLRQVDGTSRVGWPEGSFQAPLYDLPPFQSNPLAHSSGKGPRSRLGMEGFS